MVPGPGPRTTVFGHGHGRDRCGEPRRGAWHPPVALRSKASPFSFSGAWLRHARYGESGAAPSDSDSDSGSVRDSRQRRSPVRSRLRWIPGGVGFQPARTTSFQRDGRTAGRMPTAPWEASPRRSVAAVHRSECRPTLRGGDVSTRKLARHDMGGGTAAPHGIRHGPRSRTEPFRRTSPPCHPERACESRGPLRAWCGGHWNDRQSAAGTLFRRQ
jgi:hypothetical protein